MSKTVIKCCDGTEVDVSKMSVEQAVAKLKELASTTTCPCHIEAVTGDEKSIMEFRTEGRFYTITKQDVEKPLIQAFGEKWLVSNFMGRILPQDVGKRVYRVPCNDPRSPPILQVENDEQFKRRLGSGPKYAGWRVGKPRRKPETDEWVVPVYDPSGKRDEGKTYYAGDKEDAWKTYWVVLSEMGLKEPAPRPEPKPKETGKITWKYNRYGHVEVWKGDEDEEEADLYIQQDTDVEEFFRKIGVDPETVGPGDFDTAEDPGYFEGVSEQYEQTGGDYKTRDK